MRRRSCQGEREQSRFNEGREKAAPPTMEDERVKNSASQAKGGRTEPLWWRFPPLPRCGWCCFLLLLHLGIVVFPHPSLAWCCFLLLFLLGGAACFPSLLRLVSLSPFLACCFPFTLMCVCCFLRLLLWVMQHVLLHCTESLN